LVGMAGLKGLHYEHRLSISLVIDVFKSVLAGDKPPQDYICIVDDDGTSTATYIHESNTTGQA
jgi:hypothetical protein